MTHIRPFIILRTGYAGILIHSSLTNRKESPVPYEVREENGKYCVFNKETGDKKACHDDKGEAERQVHLLEGIEHGWKPTEK
jgi:hypothetical protein